MGLRLDGRDSEGFCPFYGFVGFSSDKHTMCVGRHDDGVLMLRAKQTYRSNVALFASLIL